MSKRCAPITISLVLLSCLLYVRFNQVEIKAPNVYFVHNLNTGLNYTTVQEAMDANETLDGHTIFVDAGTYFENVVLRKSIVLRGSSSKNTIIDGMERGDVFRVVANHTVIEGFTITNCSWDVFPSYGIAISLCSDVTVLDCIIEWNDYYGISIDNSSNIVIANSNFTFNSGDHISLSYASGCLIENNTIWGGSEGVYLYHCNNCKTKLGRAYHS